MPGQEQEQFISAESTNLKPDESLISPTHVIKIEPFFGSILSTKRRGRRRFGRRRFI